MKNSNPHFPFSRPSALALLLASMPFATRPAHAADGPWDGGYLWSMATGRPSRMTKPPKRTRGLRGPCLVKLSANIALMFLRRNFAQRCTGLQVQTGRSPVKSDHARFSARSGTWLRCARCRGASSRLASPVPLENPHRPSVAKRNPSPQAGRSLEISHSLVRGQWFVSDLHLPCTA